MVDQADLVEKLNGKYGQLYATGVIPAGTYPGQDKDNKILVVWNLLVASDKMPDQIAYDIVKTIFEHKPDLVAVHREANSIDLDNQTKANSSIPWHPGVLKYLSEKGVQM
jgi:TRAP transporter TAXI family solute receptor